MCVWYLQEQEAQSTSKERNTKGSEFIEGKLQKICVDVKLQDCSKLFALLLQNIGLE